jgi:hypothetical protein
MHKLLVSISIFFVVAFLLPTSNETFASTQITISVGVGDTIINFSGHTSPDSIVTFIENSTVIGTALSDNTGFFTKEFVNQDSGIRNIGIYSTDPDGITTSTLNFEISIAAFTTTFVSNFILPPTITASDSQTLKGDVLVLEGYAVPDSIITILFFNSDVTKATTSHETGYWVYGLSTTDLVAQQYTIYALAQTESGLISQSSSNISFIVFTQAVSDDSETSDDEDTKKDRVVSKTVVIFQDGVPFVTDIFCFLPLTFRKFDIFGRCSIYYSYMREAISMWYEAWKGEDSDISVCDFNGDSVCNLVDFSILLYSIEEKKNE